MIAAMIDNGLITAAFSLTGFALLGFFGWMAKEMSNTSGVLARLIAQQDDMERRMAAVENWWQNTESNHRNRRHDDIIS